MRAYHTYYLLVHCSAVILQLFFITGSGWLYLAPVFYGYYSGTYSFEFHNVLYEFPLAYFLVMFAIFIINLLFVISSFSKIAESETSDISQAPLSELIFGVWDYSTNEEDMAEVLKLDITGKF